jgi:transposase
MRGHDEQQEEMFSYISAEKRDVGLSVDDAVWDVTVFTKNRQRLLQGKIAEAFFDAVLQLAEQEKLLSDEHFAVDGTLIEAWVSRRSFQEKADPPERGSGQRGALDVAGHA